MIEYIKIYKNFYKTSEISQLVNDCDISMYTLHNFDSYYNSISKFNNLKKWCEENNIYTLKDYINIINNHILNSQHIFNDPNLNSYFNLYKNNEQPQTPSFLKLDVGKKYLSIDIKHAYSQLIDSTHVFREKFDDLIFNGLPDFIKNSKKIRLFMYNQIPNIECYKLYINKLFDNIFESNHIISQYLKKYNLNPISYNVDELIYDITETPTLFDEFIGDHIINNLSIHLNTFKQHYIKYIDPFTKNEETIPIREYVTHTNFVTNTCVYLNQIYKAYNNLPIIENDLYIPDKEHWKKIIKLAEPIQITNIQ
jgi:hypothetical protein